jgi:hypothetical protein
MLLMPSLITLDHMTLATLVSLNFQNQTWAFTRLWLAWAWSLGQAPGMQSIKHALSASQFKAQSEEKKEIALPCLSRPGQPTNLASGQAPKVG